MHFLKHVALNSWWWTKSRANSPKCNKPVSGPRKITIFFPVHKHSYSSVTNAVLWHVLAVICSHPEGRGSCGTKHEMPHTLEQKITSRITDFFMNHEDLTVRISLSTCCCYDLWNSVVQRLVACICSKSLGDVTACPNLSPSFTVCHHSTDVTSCVSLNRVEHVILNIILHTCVFFFFFVIRACS